MNRGITDIAWCMQASEEAGAAREKDRLDAQAWRAELGKKLDRSAALMRCGLLAIIALVTVVGFLLTRVAVLP